jgi:hypothetical protein
VRCYSHLSDDEREQIGLAKALGHSIGAIAQAIGRPKSTAWRELSAGCRAGATRCFTPPGPINCAGGVKRGSEETEPYGLSLSTGSRKGCQRQWETDPLGNSNLTNPPRWFLRQGGADANGGGTDGVGCPEEPRGRAFGSWRVLPGGCTIRCRGACMRAKRQRCANPARKTTAKRKNARYADFLEEVLRADACAGARDADASQRTRRSRLTTSRSPPAPSQIQELASLGFVARAENVASTNGRLDNAGRLTRMPNCPGIWGSFFSRFRL